MEIINGSFWIFANFDCIKCTIDLMTGRMYCEWECSSYYYKNRFGEFVFLLKKLP